MAWTTRLLSITNLQAHIEFSDGVRVMDQAFPVSDPESLKARIRQHADMIDLVDALETAFPVGDVIDLTMKDPDPPDPKAEAAALYQQKLFLLERLMREVGLKVREPDDAVLLALQAELKGLQVDAANITL